MDDSAKGVNTANPKNGKRWEHKELESVLKQSTVLRVKEQGGLYGVVRRGKDGTPSVMFRWRFRHDNKLLDFTAGTWPGDSLKSIRETHELAIAMHKAGKNPNVERSLQKKAAATSQTEQLRIHEEETVKALALRWQSLELAKRGEKGRKDNGDEVIRSFERDVFPSLGSTPIKAVPKASWASLFDDVKVRAPRMAARLFADMTQFLDWCVRRDFIDASPLQKLRKSDIAAPYRERDRFLWNPNSSTPAAELLELQKKLPSAKLQRTTEIGLWLMVATGCRVGELCNASWDHVDFESREWLFPKENTKTGAEHRVHISDFTNRLLRELYQLNGKTPWCFPSANKERPVCEKSMQKQVRDRQLAVPMKNRSTATESLNLSGGRWTVHDLRRTGARIMGGIGINALTVESCINHKMSKLMRTYQHSIPFESKKEAWDKLGQHLDLILSGKGSIPKKTVFPVVLPD
jgi:integrase